MKNVFFLVSICFLLASCSVQQKLSLHEKNDKTIQKIEKSIQEKNLTKFITYCDEQNYSAQKSIGISDEQYVFEILNIDLEHDETKTYKEGIHDFFSKIVLVEIIKDAKIINSLDKEIQYKGYIYTTDENVVEFHITLNKKGAIVGAFG